VDDYHGTPVADPYRWLEDPSDPETRAWVEAQNEATETFLAAIPPRGDFKARLAELWDYPRAGCPVQRGGRYFFTKNDGLQAQDVLYVRDGPDGAPRVALDPNALSDDGTVAITSRDFSDDGQWLAYGLSEHGSDWQAVRARHVDSGRDDPEIVRWCRFSNLSWSKDGSGFYYSRYPEPGSVAPADESRFNRVYFHRLGTPQSADPLVYAHDEDPDLRLHASVTEDGRYLALRLHRGTNVHNRFYYREIGARAGEVTTPPGPAGPGGHAPGGDGFVRLLDAEDAAYGFIGNVGSWFYFQTDLDAPRNRVIAIDVDRPARADWREVVAESEAVIAFAALAGGRLVVVYLADACYRVRVFDLDGRPLAEIPMPALGTIVGLTGRQADRELFFSVTSFAVPPTVYRYDFDAGHAAVWHRGDLPFDPDDYETRQVFYTSRDGTRVPMFVSHRRGLSLDGDRPALLTGYGGFNVPMTPAFDVTNVAWMALGGVHCVANLRGGCEYGAAWHEAGMLERKQNVFDDFAAAAEWLVASGYTRPARLAIRGGSNGGLLVAACMLQRPDLFGAVVCSRPVIDMLRYHRFTIGRFWVGETGDAEADPAHFRFLHAYSPLHNVRAGVAYPPILILTADTDDRVVPAHAYKFAATLQAVAPGPRLTLLRVETAAGHGFGTPTAKLIDEGGEVLAFLSWALGMSGVEEMALARETILGRGIPAG